MTTPPQSFEDALKDAAGIYECDDQYPGRAYDENGYKYRDFYAGARWAKQYVIRNDPTVLAMAAVLEKPFACNYCGERSDGPWGRSCPKRDSDCCNWDIDLSAALTAYREATKEG